MKTRTYYCITLNNFLNLSNLSSVYMLPNVVFPISRKLLIIGWNYQVILLLLFTDSVLQIGHETFWIVIYKSTRSYMVYFGSNPLSWSCKKHPTFAKSSTNAMYRTIMSTKTEIFWLQELLKELGVKPL